MWRVLLCRGVLLWPYLCGSDDAPATAKRGDEKKSFSAASMSAACCWPRVVGIWERFTFFN